MSHKIYISDVKTETPPKSHFAWCSCGWRSKSGLDDKRALWEGWEHQMQVDIESVINEEKT